MNPWVKTSDRLPPDETPVLILYRGGYYVASLCWEYPGWEDNWNAYRFWDNENGPEIDRLEDVEQWQLISDPGSELDKEALADEQMCVAFRARETHLAAKRIKRELLAKYRDLTGEYYEDKFFDPEDSLDVSIEEAIAGCKITRRATVRESLKARRMLRQLADYP